MIKNFLEKMVGTYSDRELKRIYPIADKVMALEPEMEALSDDELRAKTDEFRTRLTKGETLDDILPEAFAVVREASWRTLKMKHFRVQVIGGIVLHQGRISEMKTGEGKTLVATLPSYLNALTGEGVHIVTVNDYLAMRDCEWMGQIHRFLGLSVGLIVHDLDNNARREAYAADITYGTNNELGFDYLRDNMVIYKENKVQRGHAYAIVDEVDSILIDEARTPLIISGQGDKANALYEAANQFAKGLKHKKVTETDTKVHDDEVYEDVDYVVDEKARSVTLTARGVKKAESRFNIETLTDPENMAISHHINQAIRAHGLMRNEVDYVVRDGEVVIVDEFTGRMMFGRRYSDGLHQAIEAKEGVKVEHESRTLATITFQNFFRLYKKLAGMTGTAQTEESEFQQIYKLDVVAIPTNKPMIREDLPDVIYQTEDIKFNAVIEETIVAHDNGQPVLIGTVSIEKSEKLSGMLKRRGIKHEVLNAKYHEKEAEIVARAGHRGAVTIATNMAGRGTDIMPEDAPEGLYIIGTERHESRRIDNQLRGRAGRQGDKGKSRFYLSLEDDLMRLFGSDKIQSIMSFMKVDDTEPIESRMVTNAIETAQKRVEGRNFEIRKHVLQYDDVNNQQREMIYKQRNEVLEGKDLRKNIINMIETIVDKAIIVYTGEAHPEEWDFNGLKEHLSGIFMSFEMPQYSEKDIDRLTRDYLKNDLIEIFEQQYKEKEELFGENMREVERVVLLQSVDQKWMAHIDDMEQLRQGINLRAYAQHDPVVEYKFEGMNMFEDMIYSIKEDTLRVLYHIMPKSEIKRVEVAKPVAEGFGGDGTKVKKPVVKKDRVGRNDPCPCGSGKKYKKCCGFDE